jgi:cobalamin synthase
MMILRNWLQSLIEAWEMLTVIPLPKKLDLELETDPERTVACFPLVGAVIGFGAYLLASLCFLLITSDILAAAIATILITLGAELVSENGEVSLLASVLNMKLQGVPISTFKELPDTRITFDGSTSLLIFISIYLLKLICVGLLIFHFESSWLIASFALGYLLRAKLAVETQRDNSQAIIDVDDPKHVINICWFTAGAAVLVGGIASFPAPLLILILAYLLFMGFDKLLERNEMEINEKLIDIYGAAADLFFLLLITSFMARS